MKSRSGFIQGETMKAFARPKKKVSGFTMMEVMVFFCKNGILAANAIPGISDWAPDYRM